MESGVVESGTDSFSCREQTPFLALAPSLAPTAEDRGLFSLRALFLVHFPPAPFSVIGPSPVSPQASPVLRMNTL